MNNVCGRIWRHGFWFRVFGWGLHVKLRAGHVPLFSERNGYRRAAYIGPLRIETLRIRCAACGLPVEHQAEHEPWLKLERVYHSACLAREKVEEAMIDLPPVPPTDIPFGAALDSLARYSSAAMRSYGEACARAALEAAALKLIELNAWRGGQGHPPVLSPEESAAAIRALKDKP